MVGWCEVQETPSKMTPFIKIPLNTRYFFLTNSLMLAQMFMENYNLHRFTLAAERVNMLKNQHNNRNSVSKIYLAQLLQRRKECVL